MPPADCAEVQLLLRDPSRPRLDVLVTAFTVYHAVKLGHPAEVARAHKTGSYEKVHKLMKEVADAQAVKVGIAQYRPPWERRHTGSIHACLSQPEMSAPSTPKVIRFRATPDWGTSEPTTPKVVPFPATPEWSQHLEA